MKKKKKKKKGMTAGVMALSGPDDQMVTFGQI